MELWTNVINSLVLEWSCVTFITIQGSNLAQDAFNQMTNCHSRRNSMWINNHIWNDSFCGKWKIFLPISHTTSTLLAMTWSEFVANLRNLDSSHFNFDVAHFFLSDSKNNLINVTLFRMLERNRLVFSWLLSNLLVQPKTSEVILIFLYQVVLHRRFNSLTNNDIVSTDLSARWDDAIFVKLVVIPMLSTTCLVLFRHVDSLIICLTGTIGSVKNTSKETSINCRLV